MATNNSVNISTAATGKVLRSQGVGVAPVFSTATYPDTAGTSGNVLTSDGTNFLSSAPTTFSQVKLQVIVNNGTYTPTAGMKYCIVELLAGGGGGGGVAATGAAEVAAAGGGAAGQYSRKVLSAATVGASQSVTIGAGGLAGTSVPSNGSTGGDTIFGAIFTAAGGGGGTLSAATSTAKTVTGGNCTAATSGGDFTSIGAPGGAGFCIFYTNAVLISGVGGSSALGAGGVQISSITTGGTGNGAKLYGSGGSGGAGSNTTSKAGGAGIQGVCIITEYI